MALPYVPEAIRPLRRVEYDKLIELGMFDEDDRIELRSCAGSSSR